MWTVPPSISIDVTAEDLLCIRAGDPIRIPATIKGRPAPKVTWDFDGKAKSHKKNKLHTLPVDSEVRHLTWHHTFVCLKATARQISRDQLFWSCDFRLSPPIPHLL